MRGSAFDEIFQTDAESDMSTVVIWPKSKPKVEFQYGGRLGEFSGIQEAPATLQGAATWRIQ